MAASDDGMGFPEAKQVHVRAWFLGERIDLRALERGEIVTLAPLTVRAGERGYAVLFRYGVVVLVELQPVEEAAFLKTLNPFIHERVDEPESEAGDIASDAEREGRVDGQGRLLLQELSLKRIQIVAHVLAKSIVLSHYEERVATIFDRIERLAEELQRGDRRPTGGRELTRQIGDVLLTQTRTVGRVEITEKPEMTWDDPKLDRLYERLSMEYELRDRDVALSRKLDLIARTAQTYLDLLQNHQSLRVEWYIVVLILVEIVLILYDLFRAL
jgi:uncharacterized Rmd1/YagE family protein